MARATINPAGLMTAGARGHLVSTMTTKAGRRMVAVVTMVDHNRCAAWGIPTRAVELHRLVSAVTPVAGTKSQLLAQSWPDAVDQTGSDREREWIIPFAVLAIDELRTMSAEALRARGGL